MLLPNAYFISEVIGQLSESGSTVVQKAEYGSTIGWVRIDRRYEKDLSDTRHSGRRVLEREVLSLASCELWSVQLLFSQLRRDSCRS